MCHQHLLQEQAKTPSLLDHPRSHQWHQLDLILTRRKDLCNVMNTSSYHSADCDTDHSIIITKTKLIPRRFHHAKPKGKVKINIARTADQERTDNFIISIKSISPASEGESAESRWSTLSASIHRSAIEAFGKKERKNVDWYEVNFQIMEPLTKVKHQALLKWKQSPTQTNLNALRKARSDSKVVCQQLLAKIVFLN